MCDDATGHCFICNLAYCGVCKGAEDSLPTQCLGVEINEYIKEAVYHGGLDYINNQWMYTPENTK